MARRSVACSWIACGILWVFGLVPLPEGMGQESAPVEFESAPKPLVQSGEPVWSLGISPDGKWSAAGQEDGQILVRDTIAKQTRHVLKGHAGVVSALAFAPSGNPLATAGVDGQIRLWHVASGRLQFTLTGHDNWITCLSFSPDGRTLASAGYDKTVRLWNAKTGVQSALFEDHAATVRTVAFSPDGRTLVSAGDEGMIRFWNVKTGEHETPLPPQNASLRAVAFSPNGKRMLTVPESGRIQIWSLETNKAEQVLTTDAPGDADASPQTALFSPDGLSVLVGTRGGRVRIWPVETDQISPAQNSNEAADTNPRPTEPTHFSELQSLNGHEDVVTGLALPADGKTLYTGGLDGNVQVWPALLPLESPLAKLPIAAGDVWALSLSPVGNLLAVGGKGGFVELWDLTTGEPQKTLEGFEGTVDCLEHSPDGKLLAAAGWRDQTVVVWNVETGEVVNTITTADKVRSLALAPDGRQLAVGYQTASGPEIFAVPEGTSVRSLNGHGLSVYDVAFSPDGTKIASCSGEWTERKPGRVTIHDTADGAKLAQFDGHTHAVRSLAFTADGSKLCSLSQDGVLKIYEVQGLRESAMLRNGLDARPIACSSDGRLVAVGLQNGTINVWNIERREIERRLKGTDDLFSLRFSRDGSLLFAADGNEFVQIWKFSEAENSLAQTVTTWLPRSSSAPSSADTKPQETP